MAVQTSPELWFHTSSLEPHGIAWHGMAQLAMASRQVPGATAWPGAW